MTCRRKGTSRRLGGRTDRRRGRRRSTRAQTTQDFAVGISIFLITLSLALAYVPSVFTPFDGDVGTGSAAQADRAASDILNRISVEGYTTRLDAAETNTFLANNADGDALRDTLDLPSLARVNVTLERLDGSPIENECDVYPAGIGPDCHVRAGHRYRGESAGLMSRIVSLDGAQYRLLVRVWE